MDAISGVCARMAAADGDEVGAAITVAQIPRRQIAMEPIIFECLNILLMIQKWVYLLAVACQKKQMLSGYDYKV